MINWWKWLPSPGALMSRRWWVIWWGEINRPPPFDCHLPPNHSTTTNHPAGKWELLKAIYRAMWESVASPPPITPHLTHQDISGRFVQICHLAPNHSTLTHQESDLWFAIWANRANRDTVSFRQSLPTCLRALLLQMNSWQDFTPPSTRRERM